MGERILNAPATGFPTSKISGGVGRAGLGKIMSGRDHNMANRTETGSVKRVAKGRDHGNRAKNIGDSHNQLLFGGTPDEIIDSIRRRRQRFLDEKVTSLVKKLPCDGNVGVGWSADDSSMPWPGLERFLD
jgi:hypothetical protein